MEVVLYKENLFLIQWACCIAVLGYPESESSVAPSSDIASLLIDKSSPVPAT